MKVRFIQIDGHETVLHNQKKVPKYDEMSKFVGGSLERFELRVEAAGRPKGVKATMWVNESGMLLNLPVNARATRLCVIAADLMNKSLTQGIHGNVILIEPDGPKGSKE